MLFVQFNVNAHQVAPGLVKHFNLSKATVLINIK